MTVVAFRPCLVEVWAGTPKGEAALRWYVERIEAGDEGGFITADFFTENEALAEAREWGLPVFRRNQ